MQYTPTDEEKEVIRIIQSEKTNWEDGHVFVVDKVQFIMKNVVKKARKNYFGIFNSPKDPVTKREKIFIPLTEWTVETMLKNIDIDTKDIDVKSRNTNAYLKAEVFRHILKKKLDEINFGQTLNRWLRRVAIDGTAYLKAYEEDGKLGVAVVDRLNMIADPSVECLDDSAGITERFILSKPEFDELNLDGKEYVDGVTSIDRTGIEAFSPSVQSTEIPYVELFERYGYFPEYVITGKEEDKKTFFYGKATVTGLNGTPVVHSVVRLDEEENPYGEGKLKEVPNRLDGRGIPEMLFNIQAYLNEVVNTRMNKARIVQLGLFKMKGNVTPQQFAKLFTTGGIKLDQSSEIEAMNTGSIDPSTYKDEEQAYQWGTRVTGTTNEDNQAASRPATNALLEQQGASKGYNLRIEDLMLSLGKFIEKKMLPIIKKEMLADKGSLVRVTGDPKIFEKLDESLIRNQVYKNIESMSPTEKQMMRDSGVDMEMFVQQGMEQMKALGEDRYIPIIEDLFDIEYDIKVVTSDESINRSVMASMLQNTLGILASSGLPVRDTLKELYDTMGLDGEKLIQDQPVQLPQQGALQQGSPETVANSMPQPSAI
jgi:hypothetical protein